jgi:hypothetical protein
VRDLTLGNTVEAGLHDVDTSGLDAPVSEHVASVVAHGDEPVRAQQGLLNNSLAVSLIAGDAGQLVDQRHDGSGGTPEIQVRVNRDAGEGVDHDRVVAGSVERGAESRGGGLLLLG